MFKATHPKLRNKSKTCRVPVRFYKMNEIKSKFMKVRCNKCKNEQNIFNKASSVVTCLVCGEVLSTPTGGKSKIDARVLEELN